MNNKSTENLIESSESIEELHVPPLDLEQLNDDKRQKSENSDSDRALNNKPKRVNNNFLVEKSKTNETEAKSPTNPPPIPAVRKLSLPPIASQRNGKDTKENSNHLTRNRRVQSNDTIRIISERSNNKIDSNDSESGSDINQFKESIREKVNQIELKTFATQAKNNLKSTINVAEINEETTSFISYEEKHEQEDNSEHLTSNHSSVNSKELPKDNDDNERGIKNAAFVHDPADNAQDTTPRELDRKSKSKKKDKKPKVVKKSKEKRKKQPSRHTEQTTERAVANESEDDIQHVYDFKKVIGR